MRAVTVHTCPCNSLERLYWRQAGLPALNDQRSPLGSCSRRFFLTMGGEGVDDQHAYEDVG